MAGRAAPKFKEYRVPVQSLKQWVQDSAFTGLTVVEIFSSSFGQCQVILPALNTIMMQTEKAEERVKWLTLNIAKIEEEIRQVNEEHTNGATSERVKGCLQPDREERKEERTEDERKMNTRKHIGAKSNAATESTGNSSPCTHAFIPLLEAYRGYDHPRPLWLFFVKGKLQYELTSANPPKLSRLVRACLGGETVCKDELNRMELASDSKEVSDEKKRKRKLVKIQQEQEAARQKTLEDAEARKRKKEIIRSSEWLISFKITDFSIKARAEILSLNAETESLPRGIVAVLSTRENDMEDFVYQGQTERILVGVKEESFFVLASSIPLRKPAYTDEAGAVNPVELKLAVYDVESDTGILRGDKEGWLGELYIPLAQLLSQTHTNGIELKYHDRFVPPMSPSAAKSPGAVIATEKVIGRMMFDIIDRPSEGVLTDYRLLFQISKLNGAVDAGVDANDVANVNVQLFAQDVTSPLPVLIGSTEWHSFNGQAEYSLPVVVTHYSRLSRTLKFCISYGTIYVGDVELPFSFLLASRQTDHEGNELPIPLPLASPNEQNLQLLVLVQELDASGTEVVPFIQMDDHTASEVNTDKDQQVVETCTQEHARLAGKQQDVAVPEQDVVTARTSSDHCPETEVILQVLVSATNNGTIEVVLQSAEEQHLKQNPSLDNHTTATGALSDLTADVLAGDNNAAAIQAIESSSTIVFNQDGSTLKGLTNAMPSTKTCAAMPAGNLQAQTDTETLAADTDGSGPVGDNLQLH